MKVEKFLGGFILVSGLLVAGAAQAQTSDSSYAEQVKELRTLARNETRLCPPKTIERLAKAADKSPGAEDRFLTALEECLTAKEEHAAAIAAILFPEDGDIPEEDFPQDGDGGF